MSTMTIRPVDVLVHTYYKAMMEVVEADISTPPISPKALAGYPKLKRLQKEAQAIGYDLDDETATQIQADSDANS